MGPASPEKRDRLISGVAVSGGTTAQDIAIVEAAVRLATGPFIMTAITVDSENSASIDFYCRFMEPTLIVHGDADRIVPSEVSGQGMPALVKGEPLVVIKGGPHAMLDRHRGIEPGPPGIPARAEASRAAAFDGRPAAGPRQARCCEARPIDNAGRGRPPVWAFSNPNSSERLMTDLEKTRDQLAALAKLDEVLRRAAVDYWVFGGWAVRRPSRRVTRVHDDIDIAVWAADAGRVAELLRGMGWTARPEAGEDGYTCFAHGTVRLDVAFLARDAAGRVYTPLRDGRGEWPDDSFGEDVAEVAGVRVRVISREAPVADKSAIRGDAAAAAKDRQDVAVLAVRAPADPTG